MNIAGIIGGLGPETTADFYLKINKLALKYRHETKPSCVVSNVQLPFKIEDRLLKDGEGVKEYLPFLKNSIVQLEKAGVDFIVIPCNTVHALIKELRSFATVPIISIIEVTGSILKRNNVDQALLLATSVTIEEKLYNNIKVDWIIPTQDNQHIIDQIIHSLVNSLHTADEIETLQSMINYPVVVLACSDLHIAIKNTDNLVIYDTMEILAKATVEEIYKEE